MNYEFCNKLKMLREKHNLSQIEISKILNVSRATYSNYENGITEPSINTIINISNFYNVSIDFLLTNKNILSNEIINNFNDDVNFEIPKFNKDSILKSLLNKKKKYMKLLESNTLIIKKYISDIDSLIHVVQNDINFNNEIPNLENTQLNIDSTNVPYKTEIAEETSPVISIDDFNRNSIDVDFYNENNVFIVDASPFATSETSKVYSYGNISAGFPVYGEDSIDADFNIFNYDLKHDADHYFVLKVKGESMNRLYKNGDCLLVEKSCYYNLNKPVIVFLENEATVKFVEIDKYSLTTIPYSTESKFKPITYPLKDFNCYIAGNVVGVINILKEN